MKTIRLMFVILFVSCTYNDKVLPIDRLKDYALNYPVTTRIDEMNFQLAPLSGGIQKIVEQRVIDKEFKLYVSLILARHYRSHISNVNQSYVIDKFHPLWVVFERYSKIKFSSEYELSNVIYYNWLTLNVDNLGPLLKAEYELIRKELIRVGNPI